MKIFQLLSHIFYVTAIVTCNMNLCNCKCNGKHPDLQKPNCFMTKKISSNSFETILKEQFMTSSHFMKSLEIMTFHILTTPAAGMVWNFLGFFLN